ncbi:hypothetical protein [Algivirga pacifica]|uniref:PqqD family protein n=1 Tax=Algivirga pacifica TaxID=1162670 RepID=A0ABP9DCQ0_9BACT
MRFITLNSEKIVSDKFDMETIVVNLFTGSYYSLKGSAIHIFNCLEFSSHTTSTLKNYFVDLTEEQALQIDSLIEQMLSENLLLEQTQSPLIGQENIEKVNYQEISFEVFNDMQELILLDPIHEVDAKGWPHENKEG